MALSNDLKIRIDADFPGERTFKSAEASARQLERQLDKLEQAQRSMVATEMAAYREGEQRAAAHARAVEDAADAVTAANDRQGAAMGKVGAATLALSAATVTGLGLATRAAMQWEGAWAGVTKTVDGSPEQMAALEQELRGLSSTLPATHEEIAGVAEAAGQLGVKRADVAGFTRTMIDLGETTNLTADQAATGLAQLMNVMGTAPEDVGRLGATLVALGNDGASTEAEILSMAQRISGAAKLVGAGESDVLALSNAMASMGIESERGSGVAVRVLQDLYAAVAEGGDKLDAFAEVAGTSSSEFAAAFQADPIRALDSFVQGLNRVEAGGGNVVATLEGLGYVGTADTAVLLQLKGANDLLTDSLDLGNAAWQENAALAEEAAKRYQTTESRLAIARNTINDAAIDIGGNLLPALAAGGDTAANLATTFGALPEPLQRFTTFLGLGGAGVAALVGAAAIGIPKLAELATVLDDLNGGSSRLGKGLGAAVGVLTGPVGAGLAAATLLVGAFAAKQGEAKREVDALAGALEAQTGAITESARAMKIDSLVEDGVLDEAKRLGVELDVVTDAALGSAAAQKQLQDGLRAVQAEAQAGDPTGSLQAQASAYEVLIGLVDQSAGVTTKAQQAAMTKAEAMGEDAAATEDAGDAAARTAAENEALQLALTNGESAADELTQTVDALSEALDVLNGAQLDANAASRAWEESIDAAAAALEANGATLDVTTDAGRKNSAALDAMADAGRANAEAILRNTGSIDDFQGALATSREALFNTARSFGLSDEAASAYVESVLAVPSTAATQVLLSGMQNAKAQVEDLAGSLRALTKQQVVSVKVATTYTSAARPGTAQADGSVLSFFAEGAENHVAQIAPAGAMRVWAEPETGGEAYVPLAQGKRPRSKAIVQNVVERFGGTVSWLADGGLMGPGSPVSRQLLTQMLTPSSGVVSGGRYAAALDAEATTAREAADAEARLTQVRDEGRGALEALREQLSDTTEAERERRSAVEEGAAAEVRRLKDAKADDGAVAAAEARVVAVKKEHVAAEKALRREHEERVEAAEDELAARVEAAEVALTAAKDQAKAATDELTASERELAEARATALRQAEETASALTRDTGLLAALADTAVADARKAREGYEAAGDAAKAALRYSSESETHEELTDRRRESIDALIASTREYAAAQRCLGASDEDVEQAVTAAGRQVSELAKLMGLTKAEARALQEQLRAPEEGQDGQALAEAMRRQYRDRLAMAKELLELQERGASAAVVDQVAAAGPRSGLGKALLADDALITELNGLQDAITALGRDTGAAVADFRYSPSVQAEDGSYVPRSYYAQQQAQAPMQLTVNLTSPMDGRVLDTRVLEVVRGSAVETMRATGGRTTGLDGRVRA